ncbi:hypothetical protein FACS189440_12960 [Bacteroidia bacterium]|nr:hypothetical protein FACS189440_12960 [Bacteroidia bacterium]
MKRYFLSITIIAFLLLSCSKTKQGDLLEIPVDIDQNNSLPLSEIAEEITAIELELTDESVIGPIIQGVILSENEVFMATLNKIFVFSKTGKFIRSIGSQGQGPKEYTYIHNLALDEKNKRLFISSANRKIISYDLNGKFMKEKLLPELSIDDINYVNKELFLLVDYTVSDATGVYSHSALHQLNDDMQVVDSCTIRNLNFAEPSQISINGTQDYLLKGNKSLFLYYGDVFLRNNNSAEKVLRDTLYRVENNRLIPELKLKFKNDGVGKFIHLTGIYRSSRYVFGAYLNSDEKPIKEYLFCYDTKTGKGYNMQDGYMDDINQIEKKVYIRPFNLDTETFYYLHTNMKPGDLEEPNPTLYIGKLKGK